MAQLRCGHSGCPAPIGETAATPRNLGQLSSLKPGSTIAFRKASLHHQRPFFSYLYSTRSGNPVNCSQFVPAHVGSYLALFNCRPASPTPDTAIYIRPQPEESCGSLLHCRLKLGHPNRKEESETNNRPLSGPPSAQRLRAA